MYQSAQQADALNTAFRAVERELLALADAANQLSRAALVCDNPIVRAQSHDLHCIPRPSQPLDSLCRGQTDLKKYGKRRSRQPTPMRLREPDALSVAVPAPD